MKEEISPHCNRRNDITAKNKAGCTMCNLFRFLYTLLIYACEQYERKSESVKVKSTLAYLLHLVFTFPFSPFTFYTFIATLPNP